MKLRLPRKDALYSLKLVSSVRMIKNYHITDSVVIYADKDKQEFGLLVQRDDIHIRSFFPAEVQESGVYYISKENFMKALTQTESAYLMVSLGKGSSVYISDNFKQLIFKDLSDNTAVRVLVEDVHDNLSDFYSSIVTSREHYSSDGQFAIDGRDFIRFANYLLAVSNVEKSDEKFLHVFMDVASSHQIIFYATDRIRIGKKVFPVNISEDFFSKKDSKKKNSYSFSFYTESFSSFVKSLSELKKKEIFSFSINKNAKCLSYKSDNLFISINASDIEPVGYEKIFSSFNVNKTDSFCFKTQDIYDTVKRIKDIVKSNRIFFFIGENVALCSSFEDFHQSYAHEFIPAYLKTSKEVIYFCLNNNILDIIKTIDSEYVGFTVTDRNTVFIYPVDSIEKPLSLDEVFVLAEIHAVAVVLINEVLSESSINEFTAIVVNKEQENKGVSQNSCDAEIEYSEEINETDLRNSKTMDIEDILDDLER